MSKCKAVLDADRVDKIEVVGKDDKSSSSPADTKKTSKKPAGK